MSETLLVGTVPLLLYVHVLHTEKARIAMMNARSFSHPDALPLQVSPASHP